MKVIVAFLTISAAWVTFVYGQSGPTSFCPNALLCTTITSGNVSLGEEHECVLATNATELTQLYKIVTQADQPIPPTKHEALTTLNDARQSHNLIAVTMDNFSRQGITFVAISFSEDKKYSIHAFDREDNRLNIVLQSNAIPSGNVDRKIQAIPTPFYRIIALSKPLLTDLTASDWKDVTVYLNRPDGEEIRCTKPNS